MKQTGLSVVLVLACTAIALAADPPYPPSTVITRLTWDDQISKVPGVGGDNWPIAWVDDDLQIAAWGDGGGLSLGMAKVYGNPPEARSEKLDSNANTKGHGTSAIKTSGLLMVDGTLYMFVRNYRPPGKDFKHSRLGWSTDRGATFTWANWHFAETFGCPEFVQFSKDYEGARDSYVYIASQDNDNSYSFSPRIVMARAPKDKVADRSTWAFFAGMDSAGKPRWTPDVGKRKPIFEDRKGAQRIAITYNAPIKRYILTTPHCLDENMKPPGNHTPAFGVFDAPEPWGPWTTVYYDDQWGGQAKTYHQKFPTKWMSPDGKTLWLIFSGQGGNVYGFYLKKATLEVTAGQR